MASGDVSVFQRQQLINREMVTKWKSLPGLVDKLYWDKRKAEEIGAQNNTGKAIQYRRPSYVGVGVTQTTDFSTRDTSTDLSSSNLIPNYVQTVDAVGNMYIQYKVETNLQFSLQDMMYWITEKDRDMRFLDTAIAQIKDQVSLAAGNTLAQWVGQTVELDSTYSTTGQNVISSLGRAKKVMLSRRGTQEAKRKIALFNMDVLRSIAPSAATLFNFGRPQEIQGLQEAGFRPGELDLYGFGASESALLPDVVIPSTTAWPATANLSAAWGGSGAWTDVQTITVQGLQASTTFLPGFSIYVAGDYWTVPGVGTWDYTNKTWSSRKSTKVLATYTVAAGFTSDSSGNATIQVREARIYDGPFANVTGTAQIASSTVVGVVGQTSSAQTITPGFLFDPDCVLAVSPKVKVPTIGTKSITGSVGGFNYAIMQQVWPGQLQEITKLIGFFGLVVPVPEGCVKFYSDIAGTLV